MTGHANISYSKPTTHTDGGSSTAPSDGGSTSSSDNNQNKDNKNTSRNYKNKPSSQPGDTVKVENARSNNPNTSIDKFSKPNLRNNPIQDKIIQQVKSIRKIGTTREEAQRIVDEALRNGIKNARIDEGSPSGTNPVTQGPHFHVGPVNHIPIIF